MSEAWVVNASPLILLARVDRLDLLDRVAPAIAEGVDAREVHVEDAQCLAGDYPWLDPPSAFLCSRSAKPTS